MPRFLSAGFIVSVAFAVFSCLSVVLSSEVMFGWVVCVSSGSRSFSSSFVRPM